MSFVQDNKSTSTMTADSRTSAALLAQDNKTINAVGLWDSTMLPWQMDFTWLWQGNGSLLTLDTRHNG